MKVDGEGQALVEDEGKRVGGVDRDGRQNWEDMGVGREAREFSLKLAAYGFLGMGWPTEYGGKGLGPTYDFILLDELGKRWGAHVPLDVGYTMVGPTILRRGSEELKKEFLPRIIGAALMCAGVGFIALRG